MSILIIFAFLLVFIFGCTSISNSYASTKQAEAVIETNQTAQLALSGQIAISILLSLAVIILVLMIFALLYRLLKKQIPISQYSVNHFPQNDFAVLDDSNTLYQFSVLFDEKEKETSILPSGWGW
jgi:hypothetical protein